MQQRAEFVGVSTHISADLFAELEDALIGDRIASVVAVLGASDHAGVMKDLEVL